jgi:hypothetical protein
MRSVDGGESWLEVTTPLEFGSSVAFHGVTALHSNAAGAQVVWAVGSLGTALLSADNGRSFTRMTVPTEYAAATLYDVAFATDTKGWIVGAIGDSVLHTTDGGDSWTAIKTALPITWSVTYALHYTSTHRVWAAGAGGVMWSNDGEVWVPRTLPDGCAGVHLHDVHIDGDRGQVLPLAMALGSGHLPLVLRSFPGSCELRADAEQRVCGRVLWSAMARRSAALRTLGTRGLCLTYQARSLTKPSVLLPTLSWKATEPSLPETMRRCGTTWTPHPRRLTHRHRHRHRRHRRVRPSAGNKSLGHKQTVDLGSRAWHA